MSNQNIAPAIHERKGHTPGPWIYRANEYDDWGMVRAAPDAKGRMFVICQARNPSVGYDDLDKYRVSRTDPYEANGRLIAAAPELLAALKDAIEELWDRDHSHMDRISFERENASWFAAITKAEAGS